MATWLMHLLIGDHLMQDFPVSDAEAYAIGCVGADAGDLTKTEGVFDPPAYITHWTHESAGLDKSSCRYLDFYEAYLREETDRSKLSFYTGYYIHLQTDVLWHRLVYAPLLRRFQTSFPDGTNFLNRMRKSAKACEWIYLKEGHTFLLWEAMKKMDAFSLPVLPYYHEMSLTNHIHFIHNTYSKQAIASSSLPDDSIFSLSDWIAFADTAADKIRSINTENGVLPALQRRFASQTELRIPVHDGM